MAPKKNQKMSLGTFLGDQSLGSWADEMEDMPLPSSGEKTGYGQDRSRGSAFGGDRDWSSARTRDFPPREQLPLPSKPPYTAHLGNLSFEVTEGDVRDFFGSEIEKVRIVEDKIDQKPKGFGYVEFRDLDGLKQALTLSGTKFQGRDIRVSVADPPKDRPEGREISDWTRKGPLPELPAQGRRVSDRGGSHRGFDTASDAGSERGGSRRGPPEGDGRVRDFGNWERKGPLSPTSATAPPQREREGGRPRVSERTFERRPSPAWGESRSQEGSRPPRPFVERQPTAAEMDNQWRARMKPDAPVQSPQPTPEPSAPSSPAAPNAPAPAPSVRPKLNLQKRTVSDAPTGDSAAASDSKSSPFGAARPVDSATHEQQVAERRLADRKKKEEEDKAQQEKLKAEKAAKAEKQPQSPSTASGPQENGKSASTKETKENGATSPTSSRPQFEILRRMTDQEDGAGDVDEEGASIDASANGDVVDSAEKEVKPKEVTRDINAPEQSEETTAEALEDEGWSTVPSKGGKGKNNPGKMGSVVAS